MKQSSDGAILGPVLYIWLSLGPMSRTSDQQWMHMQVCVYDDCAFMHGSWVLYFSQPVMNKRIITAYKLCYV